MDPIKRLLIDEPVKGLDAERELPQRQGALAAEAATAQPVEVLGA